MPTETPSSVPAQTAPLRRAWTQPHYAKVRAGDAELGPVPNGLDDFFTKS